MEKESSVWMALLPEFQRPGNIQISFDDDGRQMHDLLGLLSSEAVHLLSAGKTWVCGEEKDVKHQ
jgi:hypothetical protein